MVLEFFLEFPLCWNFLFPNVWQFSYPEIRLSLFRKCCINFVATRSTETELFSVLKLIRLFPRGQPPLPLCTKYSGRGATPFCSREKAIRHTSNSPFPVHSRDLGDNEFGLVLMRHGNKKGCDFPSRSGSSSRSTFPTPLPSPRS